MLKRILSALLALTIIFGLSALAVTPTDYSVETPENLQAGHLYGRGCILINALTGDVLFEKNADERRYPASTTKIVTCILGIEWARANGVLDEMIVIPSNITVSSDSSKMGLTPGDSMTFMDLLYGMMLSSGNDAALAVAQLVSGNVTEFVKLMNQKAADLGLSERNTHFTNPHGLHEVNHYTTARDMAKITAYAMQDATFRSIVAATSYTVYSSFWPDGKKFESKYDLLLENKRLYYAPAIGVKTGYTKAAGRSFVGAAEQNGVTLIAVCYNPVKIDEADKTYVEAFTDCIRMFKYGFLQYGFLSFKELCQMSDSSLLSVTVRKAAKDDPGNGHVELSITDIPAGYTEGYLKSDLADPVRLDEITKDFAHRIVVEFNRDVTAPLKAGDVLGTATFTGLDGAVYEGSVVAARDVEMQPPTTDEVLDEWLEDKPVLRFFSPRHNPASWLIYIVIIGVVIFLIARAKQKRNRINRARKAAFERRKREYARRMKRQEAQQKAAKKRG
ncbi:MAG: D-alanyl-D-alanine carboxypeptidase [Clostridia bacterium]|nr:D-alanyl-D-alanine carboxypeptidase [Clostridia bacterium]MBR5257515.1 D-alanyl-D-alanine carboxypeptidase [Clostridia bacterium]MBR5986001.1 D-alanyl-D-alanine carboxypeptidase [Clostridia bacterium]